MYVAGRAFSPGLERNFGQKPVRGFRRLPMRYLEERALGTGNEAFFPIQESRPGEVTEFGLRPEGDLPGKAH